MPDALWQEALEYGLGTGLVSVLADLDDPEEIQEADPLGADEFLAALPELNRLADTETLAQWLGDVVGRPGVDRLGRASTLAAMRDVGMAIGSLQRHGVQPADVDSRLPDLLASWGRRTGMVPRDTVVHYGAWNPPGPRERRYTGDPQESTLIESTRRAAMLLPAMALHVYLAHQFGIGTDEGIRGLESGVALFRDYGDAFDTVRETVSPVFFARELRPYFEPVDVQGVRYHGPAAAFLPIYLVDTLLWGNAGERHYAMIDEAVEYGVPQWKTLLGWAREVQPLAGIYEDAVRERGASWALTREGEIIEELLALLVRFRGRHATLARHAYDAAVTQFGTGSGGYSPEILVEITHGTRDAEHGVQELVRDERRELSERSTLEES